MREYNRKRDIAYYEGYIAGLKDARFLVMSVLSDRLTPKEKELERLKKGLPERKITWAMLEARCRKDEHANS